MPPPAALASVDAPRRPAVSCIVDDCASFDELPVALMVDSMAEQAADISVSTKLRECLVQHRFGQDDAGLRIPAWWRWCRQEQARYVRLGHQLLTSARWRRAAHPNTLHGRLLHAPVDDDRCSWSERKGGRSIVPGRWIKERT